MAPAAAPILHPAIALSDVPAGARGLELARRVAADCTACDLYARATQTVFGEGRAAADLMLVGEQPGDREDLAGKPFVGPAGAMLDRALLDAGIDRERVFVTNVVKHFKWKPVAGSKRRLHERPNAAEVRACRPWLELELDIVRPELLVALGATAAQAILGPSFRITEGRGTVLEASGFRQPVIATFHPSAILRARTPEDRERMLAALVGDLEIAAQTVARRDS
ncbi:MAG TPA: UdgX family uracil-DNA binding protein [Candidatus Limnocylindrales bacterium]|nr:UdgX family uracil-DNA binding protein [Candidatus Limnocylindrales bacterium]